MSSPVSLENQLHAVWRVAEQATRSGEAISPETDLPKLFRSQPDRFVALMPKGAQAGVQGAEVSSGLLDPAQQNQVERLAKTLQSLVDANLAPNASPSELMKAMLEHLHGLQPGSSALLRALQDPAALKTAGSLDPKAEPLFFELLLLAMSRAARMRGEDRGKEMHEVSPEEAAEAGRDKEPKEDKYRRLARRLAQRAKRLIPDLIEPEADIASAEASPLENVEPLTGPAPIGKPRLKGPK